MLYVWSKYNDNRLVRDCIIAYAKLSPNQQETISSLSVQNIVKVIVGRLLTMSMVTGPILSKLNEFNELVTLMHDKIYCSVVLSPPSIVITLSCNRNLEEKFINVDGHVKYDVSNFLNGSHMSITVTGLSNVVVQNTFRLIDGGIGIDIVDWLKQPASAIWDECTIKGGCGTAIRDNKVVNACAFLVLDFTDKRVYSNRVSQTEQFKFPSQYMMTKEDLLKYLNIQERDLVLETQTKFDSMRLIVKNN